VNHFVVFTLYPDIFTSFLSQGLIGRARSEGTIVVEVINFRDRGIGKHQKVDAPPYGGGAGMLLRPEPIFDSVRDWERRNETEGLRRVLISPQGTVFNQRGAKRLCRLKGPIALICGRFEGFDERVRQFVDDEISIGDFILMGGEIGAMAIIEAVSRLIPGVLGNAESLECETFSNGLLEYSQYTRPSSFQGLAVPEVLLSGNHQEISKWRLSDSIRKTKRRRADLYNGYLTKSRES
jgi:tRNA (guanine37-N1)-methyltransferase